MSSNESKHSEPSERRSWETPELIGTQLAGRYTLSEQIGSGGQAKVFKAQDKDGNTVAIKVFDFRTFSDWKAADLLKREVNALKSLRISNIPQYIDLIEAPPFSYLIESYIPARSLDEHLKSGKRFDEATVKHILQACLPILSALHHQTTPIIHRDIKPSNILWDETLDKVWIVDLGSITAFRSQTHESTIVGTTGYAAPEQFMGKATPASDIYGLGMTAIHLLCGLAPWEMELDGLEIQYQNHLPKGLTKEMRQLLADMVAVQPSQRLATTNEVQIRLNHIPSAIYNQNETSSISNQIQYHPSKNLKPVQYKGISEGIIIGFVVACILICGIIYIIFENPIIPIIVMGLILIFGLAELITRL